MLPELGSGSGSSLPLPVLLTAGIATAVATCISATSIHLHLKNYRKPILQRMVVRIMVMVPLYAISSLISLFSLQAAFFIDVVRDIYEAFVIYCFFDLLIAYLGGERSLLITLHGRPPKYPVFPGNILWREVDVSDPYTFLFLKRGVLQYVQVKPILAVATIVLKTTGKFNEGDLRWDSGYLYVSIVYNLSICHALYCLAIFWMCVNDDLKPFRPMPKFLCVKGILFFSFWQSIFISILVAAGAIKRLGPYTDNEHISLGLTDTLICLEMPFFAIAHQYAFSTRDFVNPCAKFIARMPVYYAFRDAFGLKDVIEDSKATLRGEGMDYREFEPSEGFMHQGAGRDRRIRAGLRYSQGGKRKYWLPQPTRETMSPGGTEQRINKAVGKITGHPNEGEVYAPLLADEADEVIRSSSDFHSWEDRGDYFFDTRSGLANEGFELPFGDLDPTDEDLFDYSKKYIFGDYNYPCVDISSESARIAVWDEEERILRDERGAYFSPILGPRRVFGQQRDGYGAVGNFQRSTARVRHGSEVSTASKGKTREVIVDKEQDRFIGDSSPSEVRLKWTRARASEAIQSPRVRTLSSQGRTSSPLSSSGPPSSSSSSPRDRPPPSPRKDTERPVLPPDAVDLVVEDPHAAEEEMSYERRKGEPATRGPAGLRKVYKRGYIVEDQGEIREGEVEVRDEDRARFGIGGEEDEGDGGDDVDAVMESEEEAVRDVEGTIARVETPPVHARIHTHGFDRFAVPSEDNPWA